MSDLEQRVKVLEEKVKILEEIIGTLKNVQLSERMEKYIQSKEKSLKVVNLMNKVSDEPVFDFRKEEEFVKKVQTTKKTIENQIAEALRNTEKNLELLPDDSRYFNYEIETGLISDWNDRGKVEDEELKEYVGKGLRITSYNGFDANRIVIPQEINGQPVISIGEKAFINATISEIILPHTIKAILKKAFSGCKNLKHIDLPENLEYLGEYSFYKSGLENILIPDLIYEIPSMCFYECTKLSKVHFGNCVETIGYGAFSDCKKLCMVSLPETLKIIEKQAFNGTGIRTVIIPQGVEEIDNEAFDASYNLSKNGVICVFLGKSTKISSDILNFYGVEQLFCLPGSNAQAYAREKNIPMKPLSEFNLEELR